MKTLLEYINKTQKSKYGDITKDTTFQEFVTMLKDQGYTWNGTCERLYTTEGMSTKLIRKMRETYKSYFFKKYDYGNTWIVILHNDDISENEILEISFDESDKLRDIKFKMKPLEISGYLTTTSQSEINEINDNRTKH